MKPAIEICASPDWRSYELLDSGEGMKLERYGKFVLARPEAEAIWKKKLPEKAWQQADALFISSGEEHGGHWQSSKTLPERWIVDYKGLKCWAQLSGSRHIGIFPEQASQWDWIEQQIKAAKRPVRVLNLFGYTGLASLSAARAGAEVTHVDASRKAVNWAKENQELSGLENRSIRWMVDDALKFVQREARRGSYYDGLVLDPPKFGRGPKGEVWEFYKLIPELLAACKQVMSKDALFLVMTAYSVKASALTLYYAVDEMMNAWHGRTSVGEVVLEEKSAGRILSTAMYARWWKDNL